jgi:copper chaperone NosL
LQIWINQIGGQHIGDLNKINNLNHYIGMKAIDPKSMPELNVMPWILRALIVVGLLAAALGKRWILMIWLIVFAIVAVSGFVDYYLWGYDYGHNLDTEKAIIKVPGMSYQPPLIGSKKLLNFKAVSLPGIGGWVAIGAFLIAIGVWLGEIFRYKVKTHSKYTLKSFLSMIVLCLLFACGSRGPEQIRYGSDQCDYCKMTIADKRFGAELITSKGKILKFDSIECLAAVEIDISNKSQAALSRWVIDFNNPGRFLNCDEALIVVSERQKSPMGVGLAAVSSKALADNLINNVGGQSITWDETITLVAKVWKLERKP